MVISNILALLLLMKLRLTRNTPYSISNEEWRIDNVGWLGMEKFPAAFAYFRLSVFSVYINRCFICLLSCVYTLYLTMPKTTPVGMRRDDLFSIIGGHPSRIGRVYVLYYFGSMNFMALLFLNCVKGMQRYWLNKEKLCTFVWYIMHL